MLLLPLEVALMLTRVVSQVDLLAMVVTQAMGPDIEAAHLVVMAYLLAVVVTQAVVLDMEAALAAVNQDEAHPGVVTGPLVAVVTLMVVTAMTRRGTSLPGSRPRSDLQMR